MAKCVTRYAGFINIYIFVMGVCNALTSWNMHDVCGTEISRYDFAGEVRFDAEQLHGDVCTLTVTPQTLDQNDNNMVLFYFTAFNLHSKCSALNVTLRDGRRSRDKVVPGLPQHLCGINSSVTEQVLTTSGESLHIQVNGHRSSLWSTHFSGNFVLKFITYHTGSCHDSDAHECSNGRCIPQVYNCSENIKACGAAEDTCTEEDVDETLGGWLSNVIRYIFIFVAFICILCLLKVMLKKGRRKCGEVSQCFEECFEDCCRSLRIKCRSCRNSINLSRFPKPRLPNFIRDRLRSNTRDMTDDSTAARDNVTSGEVTNPAFSSSTEQIDQITVHPPPPVLPQPPGTGPPSYEEAMASYPPTLTSLYTNEQPPDYEEIMTPNTEASPPYQFDTFSLHSEENFGNNTNELSSSQTVLASVSNGRIMSSNQIIQSSLQTDNASILNDYLSEFGIELSDGYSTDPDWDTESTTSNIQPEQIIGTQSVSNDNVTEPDWNTESTSSNVQPEQTRETQSVSVSNERIMSSNQIIQSSLQTDNASILNDYLSEFGIELSDGYSTDIDWDTDSTTSNIQPEQTTETQSVSNVNVTEPDWDNESTSTNIQSVSIVDVTDPDWDTESTSSNIQPEQTIETQSVSNVNVTAEADDSVPPPAYAEDYAVPPPYYYEYIANVRRYKQDYVTGGDT